MSAPRGGDLLRHAADLAIAYLEGADGRRVGAPATPAELRAALGSLPEEGRDPRAVVDALAAAVDGGLTANAGGRYFGFVVGGALPATVAADWLTSAWDQNGFSWAASPAAAAAEDAAGRHILALLGLPADASFGFTTGGHEANTTALAAARRHVLGAAGHDVERDGLRGAPGIRVLASAHRHASIDAALRFLGIGDGAIVALPTDRNGAVVADAVGGALAGDAAPTIVVLQAGDVNSGAVDPVGEVCAALAGTGAWVHVDGAVGLWAAASPRHADRFGGIERADSWSTDAHKWLNVPYDCGFVACAHPASHRAALAATASYLAAGDADRRDNMDWTPQLSRRARAFVVWTALQVLGRSGVAALVERCCDLARRFAAGLAGQPGVEVLNDVVLNQVLVRFGDDDARTDAVIAALQDEGTAWFGGTLWEGRRAMRISVASWVTGEDDVDRSLAAILAAARA